MSTALSYQPPIERTVSSVSTTTIVGQHDVPEATVEALVRGDRSSLPERERAVVSFVTQVARDPDGVTDETVETLRAVGYTDEDVMELLLLTCEAATATTIASATKMRPSDRGEEAPAYLRDADAL